MNRPPLANSEHTRSTVVPILMYHSIAEPDHRWLWHHLSCPVSIFESHLRALQRGGFQTISLRALYEYMTTGQAIPARSVVLSFDDGYLDNWVYACPLLKKYGFQGTIFVNPEFVDPAQSPRPTLEDVWAARVPAGALPPAGYLSWAEMREMEKAGVMDIQSHALTHTWYFSSADIVDFHHPGDPYMWLAWNARPELKFAWLTEDQGAFVPWGTAIYRHDKSLATRRYFPAQGLDDELASYVRTHGDAAFFDASGWRRALEQVARDYVRAHGDQGRFESDEQHETRVRHELSASKQIIETQLSKTVEFLCWPGGGYDDIAVRISREVGYLASTLSSREQGKSNRFGEDPSRWARLSPPMFRWNATTVEYKGGLHLVTLLNSVRGSYLHTVLHKSLKIPFKLSQWLHLRG